MRKFIVLFLFIFLPAWLLAKTAVIYHTSDTHGFFYSSHGTGGFAALSSVLKQEKHPYLLLDSGDFSNGAPEATHSQGLNSLILMNALGYHAATLGNHEFYFGDSALKNMISSAKFPFLAANLADTSTGKQPRELLPYKVFTVNGIRIAVVGLSSTQINSSVYKLLDGEQALRSTLNRLSVSAKPGDEFQALFNQVRKQVQVQAVVLLVHNSMDNPYAGGKEFLGMLPQLFPGQIQVVLGGHLHQTRIRERGSMLFVESGSGLEGVTRVEVEIDDKTGQFISARAFYIPLSVQKWGENPAIVLLGDSLREPGLDKVLGFAKDRLSLLPKNVQEGDNELSNWMADLFKEHTGAEVFIHNIGAMRKSLESGDILVRDLEEMFPHDNSFVEMEVPGYFLRQLAEQALIPKILYVFAGMEIVAKRTESGVEVLSVTVNGEPLDDNRIYRVAANSYVAKGNKEGYLFKQIPSQNKRPFGKLSMHDVIESGFKRYSPIRAPKTGRIRFE